MALVDTDKLIFVEPLFSMSLTTVSRRESKEEPKKRKKKKRRELKGVGFHGKQKFRCRRGP